MGFILLDGTGATLELGQIMGYIATAAVAILGYLINNYLKRNDTRLDNLEKAKDESEIALNQASLESSNAITAEKERSRNEMKIIDARITDLHINILNRLDEIKDKFQEARK